MSRQSRNRGVLEQQVRRRRRLPLAGLVVLVCAVLFAVYSLRTSDADTDTTATSGAGTTQGSAAGAGGSGAAPTRPAKQVLGHPADTSGRAGAGRGRDHVVGRVYT